MKNSSKKIQPLVLICTFLLGLGVGSWLTAKGRIVRHVLRCQHTVYSVGDSRERPQTLEQEVERNSGLLLVGVLVNTKEHENKTDIIYDDFSPGTNIKFIYFTTKRTISLQSTFVTLKGLNASTEPDSVKYLRMFIHVSQQYGNKFNWFMFTENSYFVNMDKLGFLKNLHHSREFLFLPQVTRKSGRNDYRYEGQNRDIRGFERTKLDNSSGEAWEYQKSNTDIIHVIHPGMILSRPLLQRISHLTESCLNKRRGLAECFRKRVSISWINDFEVFEILST